MKLEPSSRMDRLERKRWRGKFQTWPVGSKSELKKVAKDFSRYTKVNDAKGGVGLRKSLIIMLIAPELSPSQVVSSFPPKDVK